MVRTPTQNQTEQQKTAKHAKEGVDAPKNSSVMRARRSFHSAGTVRAAFRYAMIVSRPMPGELPMGLRGYVLTVAG